MAPAAAEVNPGPGALGLGSEKGALTKGSCPFIADCNHIRRARASALARQGLGGSIHNAAHGGVKRDDGKGESQSGSLADLAFGLVLVPVRLSPELHALRRSLYRVPPSAPERTLQASG